MAQTVMKPMVPGGGIEPPTRGFSIPVQFNENNGLACNGYETGREHTTINQAACKPEAA